MPTILVVCTGNVCRSPVAEASLRRAVGVRLGDAAPQVASAGTAGWDGSPATEGSVEAALEHGIDISGHEARTLTPAMIERADLVICMAGEHRAAVVRWVASAAARTFTLKELVPLLEAAPLTEPALGPRLEDRVTEADARRSSAAQAWATEDQDVADPLGMPFDAYRAMTDELVAWTDRLAEGLFGPARTPLPAAPGRVRG